MGAEQGVLETESRMKKELTTQVGPDGLLTLSVPMGKNGANKIVHVVVETVEEPGSRQAGSQEEWARFVQLMAGRIYRPNFLPSATLTDSFHNYLFSILLSQILAKRRVGDIILVSSIA